MSRQVMCTRGAIIHGSNVHKGGGGGAEVEKYCFMPFFSNEIGESVLLCYLPNRSCLSFINRTIFS